MRRVLVRDLSIEEIEQIAEQFKEDLTREAKRAVRQKNMEAAMAAISAEEYVDKFVYDLKLRAGSQLREYLSKPARARAINIRPDLQSNRK